MKLSVFNKSILKYRLGRIIEDAEELKKYDNIKLDLSLSELKELASAYDYYLTMMHIEDDCEDYYEDNRLGKKRQSC